MADILNFNDNQFSKGELNAGQTRLLQNIKKQGYNVIFDDDLKMFKIYTNDTDFMVIDKDMFDGNNKYKLKSAFFYNDNDASATREIYLDGNKYQKGIEFSTPEEAQNELDSNEALKRECKNGIDVLLKDYRKTDLLSILAPNSPSVKKIQYIQTNIINQGLLLPSFKTTYYKQSTQLFGTDKELYHFYAAFTLFGASDMYGAHVEYTIYSDPRTHFNASIKVIAPHDENPITGIKIDPEVKLHYHNAFCFEQMNQLMNIEKAYISPRAK